MLFKDAVELLPVPFEDAVELLSVSFEDAEELLTVLPRRNACARSVAQKAIRRRCEGKV